MYGDAENATNQKSTFSLFFTMSRPTCPFKLFRQVQFQRQAWIPHWKSWSGKFACATWVTWLYSSKPFQEHALWLDKVLACLSTAALVLNSQKCHFGKMQMTTLGHLVDANGMRCDPDKTATLIEFKCLVSVTQHCNFLGLCSYFRTFTHYFADIADLLNALLPKNASLSWTIECD